MLIEIAHFLSILATGLFFLCFIFSFFLNSKDIYIINLVSRIYTHSFLIFLSSFFIYIWLAITDNFSVLYIAQHSNINLPVFYKVSSIWSAHEGSMFLWIIFLTLWGAIYNIATSNKQLLKARTLGVISLTSVGFLLFLLLTSNPFDTILPYLEFSDKSWQRKITDIQWMLGHLTEALPWVRCGVSRHQHKMCGHQSKV